MVILQISVSVHAVDGILQIIVSVHAVEGVLQISVSVHAIDGSFTDQCKCSCSRW